MHKRLNVATSQRNPMSCCRVANIVNLLEKKIGCPWLLFFETESQTSLGQRNNPKQLCVQKLRLKQLNWTRIVFRMFIGISSDRHALKIDILRSPIDGRKIGVPQPWSHLRFLFSLGGASYEISRSKSRDQQTDIWYLTHFNSTSLLFSEREWIICFKSLQ